MEDYVNKMAMLWTKAKNAGFTIGEDVIGSLMLGGLPAEYRPMVLGIENGGKDITVDYVKTVLLQEVAFERNEPENALAAYSKKKFNSKQKKVRKCYSCGSTSHLANNCFKKNGKNEKKEKEDVLWASFLVNDNYKNEWFFDSGATAHMTNSTTHLLNADSSFRREIVTADDSKMQVECIGDIEKCMLIENEVKKIKINNVQYVPNIVTNLLSVSQIVKNGNEVLFTKIGCKVFNSKHEIVATGILINNMFKLNTICEKSALIMNNNNTENVMVVKSTSKAINNIFLWHRRLGHISFANISYLNRLISDPISRQFNWRQKILCDIYRRFFQKKFLFT